MHPGEQHVVAQVIEMRYAAVFRPQVFDRRRYVDRTYAAPAKPHRHFGVEIEAAHPAAVCHHLPQGARRVDAEAEQRIADALPQGFQIGPPVGDHVAAHPYQWGARVEHRQPQNERMRIFQRGAHEFRDFVGGVLAVGIHGQHMGEAGFKRGFQAMQNRRSLALVVRQYHDFQPGILSGHGLEDLPGAVAAAVHHHPHRLPELPGFAHGLENRCAGVVAGNEHEMRAGGGCHLQAFIAVFMGEIPYFVLLAEILLKLGDEGFNLAIYLETLS
jgi:hypothetical protein